MNDKDANRQIEQMVMFIKQEAEEKADEIRMSAQEEFNIEKQNLLETEKQRIRKEYERKEVQVEALKKIDASKQQNEKRLNILGAKQQLIREVFLEAREKLKEITKDEAEYTELMAELLVQAMHKLQEPSQIVQCREADVAILEAAVPVASAKYQTVFSTDAPQTTIDKKHFLPPAPAADVLEDSEASSCLGGVVVTSINGRIVVNNTLDTRLRIVEEEQLPAIREMLFA